MEGFKSVMELRLHPTQLGQRVFRIGLFSQNGYVVEEDAEDLILRIYVKEAE